MHRQTIPDEEHGAAHVGHPNGRPEATEPHTLAAQRDRTCLRGVALKESTVLKRGASRCLLRPDTRLPNELNRRAYTVNRRPPVEQRPPNDIRRAAPLPGEHQPWLASNSPGWRATALSGGARDRRAGLLLAKHRCCSPDRTVARQTGLMLAKQGWCSSISLAWQALLGEQRSKTLDLARKSPRGETPPPWPRATTKRS